MYWGDRDPYHAEKAVMPALISRNSPIQPMHGILWLFLTSLLTGWMMFRTRKEECFSGKKQVQEVVNKYKFPAEFAGSLFLIILLCLLLASAVFQSNGCPEMTLFQGSLYTVAFITATTTVIHLLCRIRKDWDEHDFTPPRPIGQECPPQTPEATEIFPADCGLLRTGLFNLPDFAFFMVIGRQGKRPFPGHRTKRGQPFPKMERAPGFSQQRSRKKYSVNGRNRSVTRMDRKETLPWQPLFPRKESVPPGKVHSGPVQLISVQRQGIPPTKYARL